MVMNQRWFFWVKRSSKDAPSEDKNFNYWLPHDEAHVLKGEGVSLHIPAESFYQDMALNFRGFEGCLC